MKILCLLLFIYSSALIADCQVSNGRTLVKIPESKQLSLFDKNKSLSTFHTQDQDGLSTCYANATSAMLKSVLPNNPDVSYTQAAVSANTRGWRDNWKNGAKKYLKDEEDGTDFTAGGWVCNTIAAMKKAGGACPKNLSILENDQNYIDPEVQSKLLVGLGKYYDSFNKRIENDHSVAQLKKELAIAFELINYKATEMKANCEERKKQKFPLELPFKRLIGPAVHFHLGKTNHPCSENRLKRLKNLVSSNSSVKKDRVFLEPSEVVSKGLLSIFESDPEFAKSVDEFINKEELDNELRNTLATKLLPKLDKLFAPLTAGDEKGLDCAVAFDKSLPLGKYPETRAQDFLYNMREQRHMSCQSNLTEDDGAFMLLTANEQFACLDQDNFEKILGAVIPLANVGSILSQKLSNDLSNPRSHYAHQITNIIMPGCLDKKNLINLDKVSCASFSNCDTRGTGTDYDNTNYNGPKGGCYKKEDAQNLMRMRVFNNIKAGSAIGVGVCTGFMTDPKARTGFCKKELPGVEGHGMHEMTISGYRCVKGKIEYEVLNSWGASCPAENDDKNEALECIKDKDGHLTGRFWVKEEVLVDNTTDVTTLHKRK